MPRKFRMICPCGELRDVDSVVALCVDCRRDIEARYSTDRRRRNGAMPIEEYLAQRKANAITDEERRRRDRERKKKWARSSKPTKRKPLNETAAEQERQSFIDSLISKYRRVEPGVSGWGR